MPSTAVTSRGSGVFAREGPAWTARASSAIAGVTRAWGIFFFLTEPCARAHGDAVRARGAFGDG